MGELAVAVDRAGNALEVANSISILFRNRREVRPSHDPTNRARPSREAQPGLKRKRMNGAESRGQEQNAPEIFEPQVMAPIARRLADSPAGVVPVCGTHKVPATIIARVCRRVAVVVINWGVPA